MSNIDRGTETRDLNVEIGEVRTCFRDKTSDALGKRRSLYTFGDIWRHFLWHS